MKQFKVGDLVSYLGAVHKIERISEFSNCCYLSGVEEAVGLWRLESVTTESKESE